MIENINNIDSDSNNNLYFLNNLYQTLEIFHILWS